MSFHLLHRQLLNRVPWTFLPLEVRLDVEEGEEEDEDKHLPRRALQDRGQADGGGRRAAGGGEGGGGGSSISSGGNDSSINSSTYRRNQRRQELLRELQRLQQDNIENSRGRQIAGVTHTNTITTTYKDGGTPTVSRSSSRVSN